MSAGLLNWSVDGFAPLSLAGEGTVEFGSSEFLEVLEDSGVPLVSFVGLD